MSSDCRRTTYPRRLPWGGKLPKCRPVSDCRLPTYPRRERWATGRRDWVGQRKSKATHPTSPSVTRGTIVGAVRVEDLGGS